MPSPFPGMDPYLEQYWQDVHTILISDTWRVLNRELPAGLVARVEERISLRSDSDDRSSRLIGPDVRVFKPNATVATHEVGREAAVLTAPLELEPTDDPAVERYLRIVDGENRLVTVIEFVSPANKRSPGLAQFRRNRDDLLTAGVQFVEIDLVREGRWRALLAPYHVPAAYVTTYRATVYTVGTDGRRAFFYPMSVRQPLPDVPVPLRPDDPPATIPLQRLVAGVYDDGRYDQVFDYARPPDPPLRGGDAAWARSICE